MLGPLPPGWADVLAEGADPTGVDDSTEAFENALALIPSGGRLLVPPGDYLINRALILPSGMLVSGSGWSSRIIVAEGFVNPGDDAAGTYSIFVNANHAADTITDSDITIQDLYFDNSRNPLFGAFHHVKFRMAERVRVLNCRFDYGGDAVAVRGCDDVIIAFCNATNQTNCAYDCWEGCNDVTISQNYAAGTSAVQFINFNPETEPPYASGTNSRRFRMIGNTLDGTGSAAVVPCQIEPLTNNSTYIQDATIQGNTFYQSRLACRGDVRGLTITGNTFRGMGFASEAIAVYPIFGTAATGVMIQGNVIADAATSGGNGGVIRCETNDAAIVGNWVGGTGYAGQAIYVGSYRPSVIANRVETSVAGATSGLPKFLQSGFRVINTSDNYIGWEDASGSTGLRIFVQADNNLIIQSSDSSGAARVVWSLPTRSSTSELVQGIGSRIDGAVRIVPATGLTATGSTAGTALLLTKNANEVTTVSAGTGVRLPSSGVNNVTGIPVVVFNRGANTLNVYPPSGGDIDGLGTDVAYTLAAGASKAFWAMSNTQYFSWG